MRPVLLLLCAIAFNPFPAAGNVIYNNADGITAQPPGDQGWSVTGAFQGGGGVAIAPSFFLTAQHLGISDGDAFVLNGNVYTVNSWSDIAGTDLRVAHIGSTFPSFATLYSGGAGSEVGKTVSMIGFGPSQLGAAISTNGVPNGWFWAGPAVKNYATNVVVTAGVQSFSPTSSFVTVQFNPTPITNPSPGMYTFGDSGGGNFILNNGAYQLASLTYGIDAYAQYNSANMTYTDLDNSAALTGAAIYNAAGLYEQTGVDGTNNPIYAPATDIYENGYSTEIAPFVAQIDAITGVPEPAAALGIGAFCLLGLLARRPRSV